MESAQPGLHDDADIIDGTVEEGPHHVCRGREAVLRESLSTELPGV